MFLEKGKQSVPKTPSSPPLRGSPISVFHPKDGISHIQQLTADISVSERAFFNKTSKLVNNTTQGMMCTLTESGSPVKQ
jgi:hypothetical protein